MLLEMIPFMNYEFVRNDNYLYNRGESTKQFFFILRGNVSIREKYKKEKQEDKKISENNTNNLTNQKIENKRPHSNYEKNKSNNQEENKIKNIGFRKKLQLNEEDYTHSPANNENNARGITPKQGGKKNNSSTKKLYGKYLRFI